MKPKPALLSFISSAAALTLIIAVLPATTSFASGENAESATAVQEANVLIEKLGALLKATPKNSAQIVSAFARRMVDGQGGKSSIFRRLDAKDRFEVLTKTGDALSGHFKPRRNSKVGNDLYGFHLDFLKSLKKSETVSAAYNLAELQRGSRLLELINSNHPNRYDTFIGLAIQIKKTALVYVKDEKKFAGVTSENNGTDSRIHHIYQGGTSNYCVSACAAMALGKLTGAKLNHIITPNNEVYMPLRLIASVYADSSKRGRKGADPRLYFPLLGLSVENHTYQEGELVALQKMSGPNRVKFAINEIEEHLVPALHMNKLVCLIIDVEIAIDHAILLSGVAPNGQIIVDDPANTQAHLMNIEEIAKVWAGAGRAGGNLFAAFISFPPNKPKQQKLITKNVSLELSKITINSFLELPEIEKRHLSLEKLNTDINFRWEDMIAKSRKNRNLRSIEGLPYVIKLQLVAGMPLKLRTNDKKFVLVTGFSGDLTDKENKFQIYDQEGGGEWLDWAAILRMIKVKPEVGDDTAFFGFMRYD